MHDIEQTVILTKNGTPLRIKDIAEVSQGPKIRLGQFAKAVHREDGKIVDNDDVVSGIVLLRKGAAADMALQGIHEKVKELNDHILPPGVKVVPFIDRSDLVRSPRHTVLHNLTEGIILVSIILFLFLGNVRGALIVAATIPFSLLFASICLDLRHIPANLLSLGALDFGMVVDGAVVMVENIVRHLGHEMGIRKLSEKIARPRTRCSGRCSMRSPSSLPLICRSSHCNGLRGGCFIPWPGRWRLPSWGIAVLDCGRARAGQLWFAKGAKEWHNPFMISSLSDIAKRFGRRFNIAGSR